MKKVLSLSLALLLVAPVVASAQIERPDGDNRPERGRPAARLGDRLLGRPEQRNNEDRPEVAGTENWQQKTREYRDQIKTERENRWQNASSTATSTERRDLRGEDRRQAEGERMSIRGERIKLYADYLLQRLERQINNVENLISRTKNRAQIMATNGKDVTGVNAKISQADSALNGAKDAIKLLPGQFNNVASSSASSTKPIQNLQSAAEAVVEAIKQAHSLIVEAITMINQGKNN